MKKNSKINTWLDRPVFSIWPKFTIYHLIVGVVLLTAILSRFIMLGERTMSHDEVNHVVPSYNFYTGSGYRYDPVTHGPLQFHLITLSYMLFGDSDFSARVPDAVFGIGVVVFAIFAFKRYLGKAGSLVAGFLFTISPYISFYSRYTRNEIYIVFWGMALIWGVLRYLELGKKRTLIFITIITALHFTDKATSYIFTAELLIFLAVVFLARVITKPWRSKNLRHIVLLIAGIVMVLGLALFAFGYTALSNAPQSTEEDSVGIMFNELSVTTRLIIGGLTVGVLVGLGIAAFLLVKGLGWHDIRDERTFDLLIMQITIVLPLLAALPMDILGFNPLDYSSQGILTSVLFLLPLVLIAVVIGIWWNWKTWLLNIGIFWGIFMLFYTTLFTQGSGFAMGLMGALGYWMAQQGVTRGTQPLYYYAVVQIPMYEYLPAFGTVLAALMGIPLALRKLRLGRKKSDPENIETVNETVDQENLAEEIIDDSSLETSPIETQISLEATLDEEVIEEEVEEEIEEEPPSRIVDNEGILRKPPVLGLLLFWSVMSLIAFSFAGERMPWLTTHIAMPMILASGWSFGRLLEYFDWEITKRHKGWLVALVALIFLLATAQTFGVMFSSNPPFQGKTLTQLEATSTFLLAAVGMVGSSVGLSLLVMNWPFKQIGRFVLLLYVGILSVITIRTSFRANFIFYDTAQEFLVYAHAAGDPKDVLKQIEEISQRTTGGKDIIVAYDSDLLYPYWWYFRDYPNKRWYPENPTRDLRDAPIILVGSGNYGLIDPVVGDDYIRNDYHRLWWPSQAYYNLTFERAWNALKDANMRSALWQIWFNRNYEPYATLAGIDTLTVENWQPSDSFRMYIRKDLVSEIWEYGATPISMEPTVDPYEANTVNIDADLVVTGNADFQMNAPKDLAIGPDGRVYVADARNHRILILDENGNYIDSFGQFGSSDYNTNIMAPDGTFNEPWGVAVGADGYVYVADTWNNRIQKFDADGNFITKWGEFGAGETAYDFWGPRGVAVDNQGRVYVADTGNKRVVIFDSDGNALNEFGGAGMGIGQYDEPVGIDVDDQGRIYIADTWNARVQVMIPSGDTLTYPSNINWDIDAWYSDSLENKPFLTVDDQYNTYVADPIMGRVLVFDMNGNFILGFGGFGPGLNEIGIVGGIAISPEGHVWVSDALNNRLMRFPVAAHLNGQNLNNQDDTFGVQTLEDQFGITLSVGTSPENTGTLSIEPIQDNYNFGDIVTISAEPNSGWSFAGWSGDAEGMENPLMLNIKAETNIIANFIQSGYSLEVNLSPEAQGSVNIAPLHTAYEFDDQITLTAIADPGWTFSGWGGDLTGLDNPITFNIQNNLSITANFTQNEYSLSVNASTTGSGSILIDPDQPIFGFDDFVTLTAYANPGWSFVGWSGDFDGTANPVTINIKENTNITANFSLNTYSLTVDILPLTGGNVMIDPLQPVYYYGNQITLKAMANPGWKFTGWGGDAAGTGETLVIYIGKDMMVTVNFAEK